ncbi:YfiR family protein [Pectobacterium sp. B1J-3]|uniref:YfiR family protein n=1 Tax=Pectobacterium sp. B1J-3 TaxID=3385371 RepID=UPI0039061542
MIKSSFVFILFFVISILSLPTKASEPNQLIAEMTKISPDQIYQTVSGIISYSRWPVPKTPPTLCVSSSAYFLTPLTVRKETKNAPKFNAVVLQKLDDIQQLQCDAIYFGKESVSQQIEIASRSPNQPLLTIAEQNPECVSGSSFCLLFSDQNVRFSVNLNHLSRSGIRVHPDVLILARH